MIANRKYYDQTCVFSKTHHSLVITHHSPLRINDSNQTLDEWIKQCVQNLYEHKIVACTMHAIPKYKTETKLKLKTKLL